LIISTSIGIGIYPDDAEDQETLAKCADAALYGAKDKGKNGYEFYTREMTRTASNLLAIDRGLRVAIEDKEFVLHYQPQIDLSTGRIVGVEALIRWDSPARGFQSPIEFIHVAEETGLIDAIGDWVLDAACAQLRAWRLAGAPPVRMAINLSPRQIRNERFVDKVRRTLLACDPRDCAGLDLEITESALQTGAHTVAALKELKSFGINIVIDDFGTGYSCLNSLKHLPIDVLKIDRSFIHGIPDDADDKAIATTIIAMAHSLGMRVIAEGVETQEQLQFVTDQHCDEVQGYLFFQPLSAHECERALMAELRGPAMLATQAREQRPPL
jgi:EAL domain-containing protein (putative c-di-GMP-specific phosphodiesterase class I)